MTRLLLARHGDVDWSGRLGAIDDPLSELGRRQAAALADRLAAHGVAAVHSSPFRRAAETAEIIAARLGVPLRWEQRLQDGHLGEYAEMPNEEVKTRYPLLWQALQTATWFDPPGGETPLQIQQRVVAALEEIAANNSGEEVLVISHGAALTSYLSHLLDLPMESGQRMAFVLQHCALSQVRLSSPPVVLAVNDAAHLEGLS